MEEIKIPSNSLWMYLEKEHLDLDNKLTQEEWEWFVNMFQLTYVDICTEEGQVLFADYCDADKGWAYSRRLRKFINPSGLLTFEDVIEQAIKAEFPRGES